MLVGIDPGAGSLITAVVRFFDGSEAVFSLSNKEYQHLCKFKQHRMWLDLMYKKLGLKTWQSQTPSPKVQTIEEFEAYLRYTYQGDFLQKQLKLHMTHTARGNRFESYICKKKTIQKVTQTIIEAKPQENGPKEEKPNNGKAKEEDPKNGNPKKKKQKKARQKKKSQRKPFQSQRTYSWPLETRRGPESGDTHLRREEKSS